MIIRQIKTGGLGNFSYLVGCEKTHEAAVIDPSHDIEQILALADHDHLKIRFIINTHGHADHVAGNAELKQRTGALIVMHKADAHPHEVDLKLDDTKNFGVGEICFKVFETPGHTPGSISLYADGQLFTGDTLFVGDSGRTDLAGGHRPALGASIRKLMELPEETVVWPGHDYGPTPYSTLKWEKTHNVNAKEYGFFISPKG